MNQTILIALFITAGTLAAPKSSIANEPIDILVALAPGASVIDASAWREYCKTG